MFVRTQTRAEEWVNSLTHGAGLVLAIASAIVGWPFAHEEVHRMSLWGAGIYLATMILLYATSTVYHGLPEGKTKRAFVMLDYCAIYLFIAGTYTPFALGVLYGHGGTALLVAIWVLAAAGIALRVTGRLAHPVRSSVFYLALGWLVLIVVKPLVSTLPTAGLVWLVAGGLAYSGGVAFFLLDSRIKFAHSIWHLFVLAGSACHFAAVAWYS